MPDPTATHTTDRLRYLWVDLETTGLNDEHDAIIEVAAVGTNADFEHLFVVAEPVQPTSEGLQRLYPSDFLVQLHTGSGLLADIGRPQAMRLVEVERRIVEHIGSFGLAGPHLTLAGSGVSHFHVRFIKRHMSTLASRLHYSTLDVGIMRRAHQDWTGGDLTSVNEDKTHRSLDDVRCHIAEATAYRTMFVAHAQKAASR